MEKLLVLFVTALAVSAHGAACQFLESSSDAAVSAEESLALMLPDKPVSKECQDCLMKATSQYWKKMVDEYMGKSCAPWKGKVKTDCETRIYRSLGFNLTIDSPFPYALGMCNAGRRCGDSSLSHNPESSSNNLKEASADDLLTSERSFLQLQQSPDAPVTPANDECSKCTIDMALKLMAKCPAFVDAMCAMPPVPKEQGMTLEMLRKETQCMLAKTNDATVEGYCGGYMRPYEQAKGYCTGMNICRPSV